MPNLTCCDLVQHPKTPVESLINMGIVAVVFSEDKPGFAPIAGYTQRPGVATQKFWLKFGLLYVILNGHLVGPLKTCNGAFYRFHSELCIRPLSTNFYHHCHTITFASHIERVPVLPLLEALEEATDKYYHPTVLVATPLWGDFPPEMVAAGTRFITPRDNIGGLKTQVLVEHIATNNPRAVVMHGAGRGNSMFALFEACVITGKPGKFFLWRHHTYVIPALWGFEVSVDWSRDFASVEQIAMHYAASSRSFVGLGGERCVDSSQEYWNKVFTSSYPEGWVIPHLTMPVGSGTTLKGLMHAAVNNRTLEGPVVACCVGREVAFSAPVTSTRAMPSYGLPADDLGYNVHATYDAKIFSEPVVKDGVVVISAQATPVFPPGFFPMKLFVSSHPDMIRYCTAMGLKPEYFASTRCSVNFPWTGMRHDFPPRLVRAALAGMVPLFFKEDKNSAVLPIHEFIRKTKLKKSPSPFGGPRQVSFPATKQFQRSVPWLCVYANVLLTGKGGFNVRADILRKELDFALADADGIIPLAKNPPETRRGVSIHDVCNPGLPEAPKPRLVFGHALKSSVNGAILPAMLQPFGFMNTPHDQLDLLPTDVLAFHTTLPGIPVRVTLLTHRIGMVRSNIAGKMRSSQGLGMLILPLGTLAHSELVNARLSDLGYVAEIYHLMYADIQYAVEDGVEIAPFHGLLSKQHYTPVPYYPGRFDGSVQDCPLPEAVPPLDGTLFGTLFEE